MNKKIAVSLFFFLLTISEGFAQKEEDKSNLMKFEVGELKTEYPTPRFSSGMGTIYMYNGPLINGIANLIQTPMSRIKFSDNIPLKYIYYRGEMVIRDVIDTKLLILKTLQYNYKFNIYDIEDTTEVWTLKQLDSTKLQIHSMERDGPGGSGASGGLWGAIDKPLSSICIVVEFVAKIITLDDTNDKKHYNIPNIPVAFMKKEKFDELNNLLLENHGLKFFKEKRLERLKFIKFEDASETKN